MVNGFFKRMWNWLDRKSNRGLVIVIATAAVPLIAAIGLIVTLLTPASGVRMSIPEFQDALERRAEEVRNSLATAHGEERIRLENENAEIARQLADVQAAYTERQERISELEASLARLSTDVDDDGLADARTALAAGDFSKADALLAGIEANAEVAIDRAAEAAFQRGKVAAAQIRWDEAAAHFNKAARLRPTYHRLRQAGTFAQLSGRYPNALRHLRHLLDLSRRDYGEKSPETGAALNDLAILLAKVGQHGEAEPLYRTALEIYRETHGERNSDYAALLNNFANLLSNTGRHAEAEPLHRKSLEVSRATQGAQHPDYAARLSNLAVVLARTGRRKQAERLYRQALEVTRTTLGQRHPDYADRLGNLATLLANTGRREEAERLFRQALEVTQTTLGERHPDYAFWLSNLAALLAHVGRRDEAEGLYRQALEVIQAPLGEAHPDHAVRLGNFAMLLMKTGRHKEAEPLLRQALQVSRKTLGDAHGKTRRIAGNYARLLRARFPDSPALAQLRAVFGNDIGIP